MCFKRKKRLPERTLNIWNRHDFAMAGLGEKLQTKAELEENNKRGGGGTIHFM